MIFLSETTNWGSTKLGIAGVDILVYGLFLLAVVHVRARKASWACSRRGRGARR